MGFLSCEYDKVTAMSSIKTTQIDGDVAVGRNVTMGGKAVIAGTVEIGHNLKVKGWLDAPNVKGVNKGVFMSVAQLEEAYPTPQDGWLAAVGTSTPFAAYVGADGEWTATGGTVELTVDIAAYEALLEEIAANSIVSGFIPCSSVGDLPSEEPDNPTVGFLIGGSLYVWVGEGGDTAGGKYYNYGPLRGQTGATGEKGNPGINLGTDFEAFGALSDIDGKTDEQKEAMVPNGKVVEEMYRFSSALTPYHAAYTNRMLNASGASVAPSSGNGSRLVVVYDISALMGYDLDFSSYINYASGTTWAVWKEGTTISSTGLSQNTDTRTMGTASAKGNFSGHYTVVEGDKWLALVNYTGYTASATASKSMKDQIGVNAANIAVLREDVDAMGTVTKEYQEIADYQNRYLNSLGVSVQPSSGNGNRRVHVWDISALVGKKLHLTGYLANAGVPWAVMSKGTKWGATGGSTPSDGSLVRVFGESTSGSFSADFVVESTDAYLAIANYKNTDLKVLEDVALTEKVAELDGYSNPQDIKDYNPMSEFLLRVKNLAFSGSAPYPLVLCHFSDIHGNDTALARLVEWCSDYKAYIDDTIHTGDSVENSYADGMAFWDGVSGAESILNCIGNHDATASGSSGGGGMAQTDYYDRFIGNYVAGWDGVVQPDGVETSGTDHYKACYYYKDYTEKQVRLVVLDCQSRTQAQLAWFRSVLADAANNGLTVIAAYHSHPISGGYTKVECPFSHITAGNVGAYSWPAIVQAVTDFKAGTLDGQTLGGSFACWLAGHQHKDVMVWYDTAGQLSIAIDSMTLSNGGRNITGKGQDCFNLIAIDTSYHIVKLLRVGNDCDAQMRHIGMCSVDYTTGEVIHAW